MITTVDKLELVVNTNIEKGEIKFEHAPENEEAYGSHGLITFDVHSRWTGDGQITPMEKLMSFTGYEFYFLVVNDQYGEVTDYPKEYTDNLLEAVLNKSDLR